MSSKVRYILVILGIIVISLIGFHIGYGLKNRTTHISFNAKDNSEEVIDKDVVEENLEEDLRKEYKVSLIMGGDALIHSAVYVDARSGNSYNFNKMLEPLKPLVSKYDLAYYNQETILGGSELGLSTYPCFNSPYEVGDSFLDLGFNIVGLANNHTLDRGEKAIINSRKYWNKKDVMVNGSATSMDERNNIMIKEKNGIKYAMLSYTTTTNGIPRKKDYLVNIYNEEEVKKDIESVRDKVDVLMVSMHWGVEYNTSVTKDQKKMAKFLSTNGVDIVIGSHPHVVEPVEFIDDTLVIYSLGNIISAQRGVEKLSGMLFSVDIHKTVEKENTEIELKNPTAHFIYTYSNYNPRTNFKVYQYKDLNDKLLPDYKKHYDMLSRRVKSLDESILVE